MSQDGWGPPEIWDFDLGRAVFRSDSRTSHSWLHQFRGETVLISEWLERITLHRLMASGREDKLSLTSALLDDGVPIQGERFSSSIELYGRAALLSSVLEHVCVWDLDELFRSEERRV